MSKKISYSVLERIARFLLLVVSVFLTLSVFLLARSCSRSKATETLQARLLSQVELQKRLLQSQASDHSLYPHLDRNVGYVLNPYMKRSTWRADPDGEGYRINSIGLRGEEIRRRKRGATRILLLGDSTLFGWMLRDEDTIASVMNSYLSAHFPQEQLEVVTAALPGWNVLSEASFLEHHFNTLQPDLIIWGLTRNDVEDVPGVVPPGQLAEWNSPQRTSHMAFAFVTEFHKDLPMPAILERWDRNGSHIRAVREKYGAPVILLWLRAQHRPFLEHVMGRWPARFPTVFVPGRFRDRTDSWCVAESDCHPSRWATRIIALGILDKLIRMGRIPDFELDEKEQDVMQAFRKEEARTIAPEQIEDFLARRLSSVPNRWTLGDPEVGDSVLYGLNVETGLIRKNGILFLRDPGGSSVLELDLRTIPNPRRLARSAVFTVRNRDGKASRRSIDVVARRTVVELPLPDPEPDAVYELHWQFDHADCPRPDACRSGKLHSASFRK